jgi:signal peptidase I
MSRVDSRNGPLEKPRIYSISGGVYSLSGKVLSELIGAVLGRGLPFRLRARGESMSPFIKDGDIITIAPFGKRLPGPGKIVAFCDPGSDRLKVHRIIRKSRRGFLARGDNVASPDGFIADDRALGLVTRIDRQARKVFWGNGPERRFLAALSRYGLLIPLVSVTRQSLRLFRPKRRTE